MAKPRIIIQIDDGTSTWVTVQPITQPDAWAIATAAGEAMGRFVYTLAADADILEARMRIALEAE